MPVYSLPDVNTGVWSMNLLAPGTVLTDLDVWKQRVYVVLNTPLGTDPLRPLFGCNYMLHIDGGALRSAAKMKKEILDALAIWVPEVTVKKITYGVSAGLIVFMITLIYQGENVTLPFKSGLKFFGGIKGYTIINGGYKWYYTNMTPTLVVDGAAATPAVPGVLPWTDIPGMMAWIRSNWGAYGRWGLGKDEVVLYLDSKYSYAELSFVTV